MDRMMIDITTLKPDGSIRTLAFIGFFKRDSDGWWYEIQDGAGTVRGDISGDYDTYLHFLDAMLKDMDGIF